MMTKRMYTHTHTHTLFLSHSHKHTLSVTQVLKKLSLQHLLLHMLPVVTSLKNVLETNKSHLQVRMVTYNIHLIHTTCTPLLTPVMIYMKLKSFCFIIYCLVFLIN